MLKTVASAALMAAFFLVAPEMAVAAEGLPIIDNATLAVKKGLMFISLVAVGFILMYAMKGQVQRVITTVCLVGLAMWMFMDTKGFTNAVTDFWRYLTG